MKTSTLIIVLVCFLIIWIPFVLFLYRKTKKVEPDDELVHFVDGEDDSIVVDKTKNQLQEQSSFILSSNDGEQLVFQRPSNDDARMFHEVGISTANKAIGDIAKTALPVMEKAYTISELNRLAPNGLFTATVDPKKLSHFVKDGSFSTIVRGDDKIEVHKGFVEVGDVSKINPAMAAQMGMQAMAAVSGQYYLTKINNQLTQLNENLDKVLEYHDNEKIAVLQNASKRFSELAVKQIVDDSDLIQLRRLGDDVSNVLHEYLPRVDAAWDKLNSDYAKNKYPLTAEEYSNAIRDWNYYASICREASRLEQISKALEIVLRQRKNMVDPALPELEDNLRASYDNCYFKREQEQYSDSMNTIALNAKRAALMGKKLERDKTKFKNLSNLNTLIEEISDSVHNSDGRVIEELLEPKSNEVLLLLDENGDDRVFISYDNLAEE